MADVEARYKNIPIIRTSLPGTKILNVKGKVCEDDISITYNPPSVIPADTSKMVYGSDYEDGENKMVDGFVDIGLPVILIRKDGYYHRPDFLSPFEVGIVFKLDSVSGEKGLFGGRWNYRDGPNATISESGNGDVWAGFSEDGSTYAKTLTLPAGTVRANKWYHFRYSWDGSIFKIGISDDFVNYTEASTEQTTGHYLRSSTKFSFGACHVTYMEGGHINLLGTYIKINGVLDWGCTYCEDEQTFDVI